MPIYTIDANIAAGKSTILEYLHTHYHLPIDLEPVKKWTPYLEDIYKNGRGAFAFQARVWLDRCWIQDKLQKKWMLMERSPFFQANAFITINEELGALTANETQILREMYAQTMAMWAPHGYIYLRSHPQRCVERMALRGRDAESAVSPEYMQRLHELHERAYVFAISIGMPVICIDVEGKTIPQLAQEVYNALCIFAQYKAK